MAPVRYEEDLGRKKAIDDKNEPPRCCAWMRPDTDEMKPIYLVVMKCSTLRPDDRHWLIGYHISDSFYRIMQLTTEKNSKHFTNWGPMTKAVVFSDIRKFVLVEMATRAQRLEWDAIAKVHPVQVVDGVYNCQTWIRQVVDVAVSKGLITRNAADAAIAGALRP